MDTATQIKSDLISRIKKSSDLNFLKAIQTIFETSEQALYPLSHEQEYSIALGRKQLANEMFSENEKVISEMKEWLAKE